MRFRKRLDVVDELRIVVRQGRGDLRYDPWTLVDKKWCTIGGWDGEKEELSCTVIEEAFDLSINTLVRDHNR